MPVFDFRKLIYEAEVNFGDKLSFYMKNHAKSDVKPDDNNNLAVLNETIDLYRYFDATAQAKFYI